MSPRTKHKYLEIRQEKTDLILSVALRLFARKGYHVTSISTIAKEAGISKGLVYNYFESKEQLLSELLNKYIRVFDSLINPNQDDEISSEEMLSFFNLLRKSLLEDNEYWKLYSQLSMQPEVLKVFIEKNNSGKLISKYQLLIYKYFADRFDNPELESFCFSSLLKGFSIQYAFAPQMFSDQLIDEFILRLKKLYIKEKIK
jgi:AcrR family transcriptional regulator